MLVVLDVDARVLRIWFFFLFTLYVAYPNTPCSDDQGQVNNTRTRVVDCVVFLFILKMKLYFSSALCASSAP